MLTLKNITKKYGKNLVLDGIAIDFNNPEGVYGILGRNGVGKTTLMKIIFNMITNYEGEVELNGTLVKNNNDQLKDILYVGGEINQYNSLFQGKITDVLKVYDLMYGTFDKKYAESLLENFDIKVKTKFSKLSMGNKTLVQNTLGLASRAPITILDEPTNGLDSVNRQNFFRYMMEDYAEYPRMFLLSTHLIQEIENYLTDVVILKDASVLLEDSLDTIQAKSYLVKNVRLENKNVIKETTFGSSIEQTIYDDLSNEDIQYIRNQGGAVESLNLQNLFNAFVEK